MEALVLLKVEPEHMLQFSHDLTHTNRPEIRRARFMDGPYDCAIEIHAHSTAQITELVTYIKGLAGKGEISTSIVVHSWSPAPAEHAW